MLSTAIGSKEHGGRVRGMSSKLSIRDGFEKDRARYRSHDHYKEEIVAAAESAMEARFKDLFFCNSRGAVAVGPTYDSCLPRGGAATDGGHAPTSTWPSEFGMCIELCRLDHSSAVPGGYHNDYYSLLVAISGRQSWKDKGSSQGLGASG